MKSPHGFTLIEIIVIVIILGFLAITLIPKISDAHKDRSSSRIKEIADNMSDAINITRDKWELDGRPLTEQINSPTPNAGSIILNNKVIWVNSSGYPFTSGARLPHSNILTTGSCKRIIRGILLDAPTVTTISSELNQEYLITTSTLNGLPACVYHAFHTLSNKTEQIPFPTVTSGQGFYYTPDTGQIVVFGL